MKPAIKTTVLAAALAGIGLMAAGCADEGLLNQDMMNSADFGRAVHEDMAAQIADPDANYRGPPPASSGERADLAQTRYATDHVKQPANQSVSNINFSGGGGGGGSTGP